MAGYEKVVDKINGGALSLLYTGIGGQAGNSLTLTQDTAFIYFILFDPLTANPELAYLFKVSKTSQGGFATMLQNRMLSHLHSPLTPLVVFFTIFLTIWLQAHPIPTSPPNPRSEPEGPKFSTIMQRDLLFSPKRWVSTASTMSTSTGPIL